MKTSCSSWSYHRTIRAGKMDQMSWLKEIAALDFDGVELLSNHFLSTERDYLVQLKKACSDLFLSVAMLSAGGKLTTNDDDKRAAEVAEIQRWTEVAEFMGAPRVRFFVGSGKDMEAGGEALYAKVLAAVREVVEFAARRGIVMAMENHGGTTAEQLLRLHRDVAHPFFRFALDTGNFPPTSQVGPATYQSIERCAPHAAIVHAKFFNVQGDGADRDFDWPRIRAILAAAGFRGFLSLEYEGEDADEVGVVRRIAPYMRAMR